MKKIYIVSEDKLEYVSEIGDKKITLNHSEGEQWTEHTKGTRIGSIKDTGNGIKLRINGIKVYLDYSTFCDLYVLMDLKVRTDSNMMNVFEYTEKIK
tara:strand:+ start:126322 stop:126612 length:291 start_codon:yes stop_codon:yes gene_type:complete